MDKSEFDDYFAELGKASDRAQSVLYVFIVVYIAMLLYGLTVFVYPAWQLLYDQANLQARCRYQSEDLKCSSLKEFVANAKLPPQLQKTMEDNFWSHQLQLFYDRSVNDRTFKFPILGWETDRDFFWLIFPLIGMISYYIVWLALSRLAGMFRFLLDRNRSDAVRLRLIGSTLMLTTPLSGEHPEITPFYQAIWRMLTAIVFFLPIFITLLAISDLTNAIPAIRDWKGMEFLNGWTGISLIKLGFEVLTLMLQVALFIKLITLARRFGRDQTEAGHLIAMLEP
jgi:hypothetical protein